MTTQINSVEHPHMTPDKIGPDDARYADLVNRGFNKRFTGKPDYVRLVDSTEQVVTALQEAVQEGRRVVVRSGGHCLEGFVSDPAVQVIIDTSLMTHVYYDPKMNAFAAECGAKLGDLYRKLFLGWGVLLPAGVSPDLGVGGHILGGAFGFMCRSYGLAVDYLYAVEVVVVDEKGTAQSVVATRESSDPNRDLWWAHTGGGGGNFGIVTRYWFRSPGAQGTDPTALLPKAPASLLRFKANWDWKDMTEASFTRLFQNYMNWCDRHSAADTPEAKLYATLIFFARWMGKIELTGVIVGGPEAQGLLTEYLAALDEGVGVTHTLEVDTTSWLAFALYPFPDFVMRGMEGGRTKIKDAFLRKPLTDQQIGVVYQNLSKAENVGGLVGMASYGGKVNTVAPDATATAQRESIITFSCSAGWMDPKDEAHSMAWVRQFYADLFAETGGVPVPGEIANGALINHPDADLADPQWNKSGVPWHTIYYKNNYARLQQAKARWDPRNIFKHALSIRVDEL
jgi:FAD binding domain/Berberine and berberine like